MHEKISELFDKDKIVFGPFWGEFGWEISRWNAFVRWFCLNNTDKEIVISTRKSSADFYYGLGDHVRLDLFDIKVDYTKNFIPDGYRAKGRRAKRISESKKSIIKEKYKDHFVFLPVNINKKIYDGIGKYDFNYKVRPDLSKDIDNIIGNNKNKKIICAVARHRKDITYRNWISNNWEILFDLLNESNKYFCIVVGQKSSVYMSKKDRNNIKYLCIEVDNPRVGHIIDIIKRSNLTIGPQTGSIILSNAIGTPTLFWGHQIKRHAETENYSKTKSIGLQEKGKKRYTTKPEIVFKNITKITK